MLIEKIFKGNKENCSAEVHVEIAPFNGDIKAVATVIKNGKKVDSLKIKSRLSRDSFDKLEWFFSQHGTDCFQTIRLWWLNEAYPAVQNAEIHRNRNTTPESRISFRHLFRYD